MILPTGYSAQRPARRRRAGLALSALCVVAGATAATGVEPSPGVKLYLERPGIYAVALSEIHRLSGRVTSPPLETLRLTHRDRAVPHRIESDGSVSGRRLLFLADTTMFRPTDPRDAAPLTVLRLTWDGDAGNGPAPPRLEDRSPRLDAAGLDGLGQAAVRRRLHLEQNVLRAPVTAGDADEVDTLWYWTMLTQQSSSQLEVELGDLSDRRREPELGITVGLLGWSRTSTPDGIRQHHVDLLLNGEKIGEGELDGRRVWSLHVPDVPARLLREGSNLLRVKIPERTIDGSGDPLLDIVYLDRIEIEYESRSPFAGGAAPLRLDASPEPRWLPDPAGSPTRRLIAAAGWSVPRGPEAGWVLPPSEATEIWIFENDAIRAPMAIEPLTSGAGSLSADVEYLMIAPPELAAGAERLAELHRRLGRTVAVVDVNAVYDAFGEGERNAEAIRRFLSYQYERSGRLRWVLLVGDADWFTPDDRSPNLRADAADRNRVPTWTFLSRYGPGASDHFYAMDAGEEAVARFAVGRLPVVDPAVLDAYVAKVVAWVVASARRPDGPSMLMLSDASKGSKLQQARLRERLADAPIDITGAERDSGDPDPDEAAIAAFRRRPSVVYFGGHGSRHLWQLGNPEDPNPASFFDREDVVRLEPTIRQPIALSISCATAPFDHPSADSLGEVMVLSGDRGAVAFVGASVALFTPPLFGESLVRGLLEEETLGDAFTTAKRLAGRAQVSHLYNLLGDPGLPLSALRPDSAIEEE